MTASNVQSIPLQVVRGCIVASIQIDLEPEVLRQFRRDLLACVQKYRAYGVILDVSGVDILDLDDFNGLRTTMQMAKVMGAQTIISGLKPGVVSALIDLGAEPEGVQAVLNLDDAFQLLDGIERQAAREVDDLEDGNQSGSDPDQE